MDLVRACDSPTNATFEFAEAAPPPSFHIGPAFFSADALALEAKIVPYERRNASTDFTPIAWRATDWESRHPGGGRFQFPPIACRATDWESRHPGGVISIHARRVTGDTTTSHCSARGQSFNSRPSCDGRRAPISRCASASRFNSRPSCDGRRTFAASMSRCASFNSRPSCDGRLGGR